jgi:hypothetical protein
LTVTQWIQVGARPTIGHITHFKNVFGDKAFTISSVTYIFILTVHNSTVKKQSFKCNFLVNSKCILKIQWVKASRSQSSVCLRSLRSKCLHTYVTCMKSSQMWLTHIHICNPGNKNEDKISQQDYQLLSVSYFLTPLFFWMHLQIFQLKPMIMHTKTSLRPWRDSNTGLLLLKWFRWPRRRE